MNTHKYQIGNAGLLKENNREMYTSREPGKDYRDTTSRSSIDFSRTHLNFNCCPHEQYISNQIKEYQEVIRGKTLPTNGVFFGSTVITLPKDYDGNVEDFFRSAYKNMKKMYRLEDEDIVSAYVHMDETTPHMHFNFIPHYRPDLHQGEKNIYKEGISWEHVIPKFIYEKQHEILEKAMSEDLGQEVHLLTGGTLGLDLQRLTTAEKQSLMTLEQLRQERTDLYAKKGEINQKFEKNNKEYSFQVVNGTPEQIDKVAYDRELLKQEMKETLEGIKLHTHQIHELEEDLCNGGRPTKSQQKVINEAIEIAHAKDTKETITQEVEETKTELKEVKTELAHTEEQAIDFAKEIEIDSITVGQLLNKAEKLMKNALNQTIPPEVQRTINILKLIATTIITVAVNNARARARHLQKPYPTTIKDLGSTFNERMEALEVKTRNMMYKQLKEAYGDELPKAAWEEASKFGKTMVELVKEDEYGHYKYIADIRREATNATQRFMEKNERKHTIDKPENSILAQIGKNKAEQVKEIAEAKTMAILEKQSLTQVMGNVNVEEFENEWERD